MVIKKILTILLKDIEYSDYYKDPMEVKLADIEQKIYFEEQLKKYKNIGKIKEVDAVEYAFFDLKNKFKGRLDFATILTIPVLQKFLYEHPYGDNSYFHFGKQNSKLSQMNAALSQEYV